MTTITPKDDELTLMSAEAMMTRVEAAIAAAHPRRNRSTRSAARVRHVRTVSLQP
jgi:hypothetical protein